MNGHKWEPITPPDANFIYDFDEIDSLQQQWLSVKREREQDNPDAYTAFLDRLARRWAIETGIIEGLYTLDRGVTETLVLRGISAELIEQGSTNTEPHELAQMLRDHQDAAEGVHLEIRENRPVSRSAIRQIHSTMTRHQSHFRALNQFGAWFDARLEHGQFKKFPNNPTRPDGAVHEYCPPEQVDSELDNLLHWYEQCRVEGFHPILIGAWFHHRFTQIHPFQDGNGRVARTLLTWHLIREDYLPVVIKRDDRERYIESLERADQGDLHSFVELLLYLQKQSILEAVGESEPAQPRQVDQVLDHIVGRISRQQATRELQLRSVSGVAEALRNKAIPMLSDRAEQISARLNGAGMTVEYSIDHGGPGDKEHWYAREVIQTANNFRHWVNRTEARYFVRVLFTPRGLPKYPRMVFVISLHSTGRQLTGIMAATAFARIEYHQESRSDDLENRAEHIFEDCTVYPFTFTWENDAESIFPRFKEWTEQCLAPAVMKWGEYLI